MSGATVAVPELYYIRALTVRMSFGRNFYHRIYNIALHCDRVILQ